MAQAEYTRTTGPNALEIRLAVQHLRKLPLNYFAHALPLLDATPLEPYALAGIAAPDWLNVTARRTKCRTRHAEPYFADPDPRLAALARGVAQHHADDHWFHESAAFTQLSLDFARQLREAFGDSSGMRPWFLGHILVELLLDAALITANPGRLDEYFEQIATLDAGFVQSSILRMAGRDPGELAWFIGKYVEIRFLADYADDGRLRYRLNQVMNRVGLKELPESFEALLPAMRQEVTASCDALTHNPDR